MKQNLFHARGARHFLNAFWQRKPMFARRALPQAGAAIDRAQLVALACRDDVESRLVVRSGAAWRVAQGPFRPRDFARLPLRGWTLLVNGVENFVPAARELQTAFGFVPYARHDDVMVSYAAPGGGVGPHFDSYDVFLLQGTGARRWQISAQRDLALVEGAPLKLLRRFRAQRTWTTQCGDLLYLPPDYAHHGVALSPCITWSVGFRAPQRNELVARILEDRHERMRPHGGYRDRGLAPQRHPAAISSSMLRRVRETVNSMHWDNADILRGLGEYLTEPPPRIVYERTGRASAAQFAHLARERGVRLDLKSRMLTRGRSVFINGESAEIAAGDIAPLRALADRRQLPPRSRLRKAALDLLYAWYRAGYIQLGDAAG